MLYAILTAALIALDQAVKYLVRAHIPLYSSRPFIPHVLQLTHVRNTGAAFSVFSGHTWLLTLISAVVSVALAALLLKGVVAHPAGRVCLSVVLAGAVGNLIDRVLFGYVTDMFDLLFLSFAIFNVADICVVCGGAATCIYLLFFYERLEVLPGGEG